jgi:hypothetical protein
MGRQYHFHATSAKINLPNESKKELFQGHKTKYSIGKPGSYAFVRLPRLLNREAPNCIRC